MRNLAGCSLSVWLLPHGCSQAPCLWQLLPIMDAYGVIAAADSAFVQAGWHNVQSMVLLLCRGLYCESVLQYSLQLLQCQCRLGSPMSSQRSFCFAGGCCCSCCSSSRSSCRPCMPGGSGMSAGQAATVREHRQYSSRLRKPWEQRSSGGTGADASAGGRAQAHASTAAATVSL